MTRRTGWLGGVLVLALVAAPAAAAQIVQVGVGAGSVRVLPEAPGGGQRFTGVVGGGEARVQVGPAHLDITYLQGALTGEADGAERDLVEGAVFAGVTPAPWISVRGGPRVRSYVTPTGTLRWVFWEAHLRGGLTIVPELLSTYLEGWWAAGGSVSGASDPGGGGIEGGLAVRLPSTPLWVRGVYRVERATVASAGGGESLERLMLTVGAAF